MSKKDYYELLGVTRSADAEEMKKSYRKLAMQYHPDRNPNNKEAEQKFKEISEAYDVLKDPDKKAAYDRFGHAAFEGGRGGAGNAAGFDFSGNFSDIFEDLFSEFTGRRSGGGGNAGAQSARQRGSDLRYNLEISLEDAFHGKKQDINITTSVSCDACHGTGGENGAEAVTCPTCGGRGTIRTQQGFFTVERTCNTCQGTGRIIEKPCRKCGGTGTVRKDRTLSVTIPSGVEEGTRIRLTGEGEAGFRGGAAGDLYIFLSVKNHPLFRREGADVHCAVPITFTTATLGGTVEVPTIEGSRVKVTIPEGTQNGHQFRLRGKGMNILRSKSRGDMFVHARIETPVKLSKKQRDLLQEFDKCSESSTSPESHSFFDKVREFWEDLKD
ncbi:MAG: molecular chaperone DnaJ [Alphaproteobacteria bacterium]|nr:MAG: molecular chaperone DnaJ [Alphaproteobacteria bacterium]TAF41289.1 MAG: molecular chaperone DnaJ [Alphaproteobacteria bacterium]TAF76276.1 MAG: molecular chaperone DnaJ [Alphaproteobacteria bacterium]